MGLMSSLTAGATVRLKENGSYQDFIVAGTATHGSGTTDKLVVRRDLLAPCYYTFGSAAYKDSSVDRWLAHGYVNTLSDTVRAAIIPATLTCYDEFNKVTETIKRTVFLLSATEMGCTNATYFKTEGTAVELFTSDASRIAYRFGEALPYGTRTPMIDPTGGNSVHIINIGSTGEWLTHPVNLYQLLTRPALILSGNLYFDSNTREVEE